MIRLLNKVLAFEMMSTDLLKDLFEKQARLVEKIKQDKPEFWELKEPFPNYRKFMLAYCIIDELTEYNNDIPWKWWKKKENYKVDDNNRIHVELPDIFHFFIQICIMEGITPEVLYEDYNEKLQENFLRQDRGY